MKRWIALLSAIVVAFASCAYSPHDRAAGPSPKAASGDVKVDFSNDGLGPRQIEDTTEIAIPRDYATAWNALETAFSQNRADILDSGFVGFARDRFAQRVSDQRKSGLRVRYIDRGHKVYVIFYSPEGSTMQLRDTAEYELEVMDGKTVISSQPVTQNYIALMTVTEDRWKIRFLQAVQ